MQSDAMGGCEITEDPEPGPSAEEPEDQVDPSDIPPPHTQLLSAAICQEKSGGSPADKGPINHQKLPVPLSWTL